MQQHVSRPRRARTEKGPDDAAGGLGAFERVRLEPLFEQVRRRLRDQLGNGVQFLFGQSRRVMTELEQPHQVTRMQRRGVGRHQADERLDGFGGARHDAGILVVGFGVFGRVTVQLAARQIVVVPQAEIIAVIHWREGGWQRQDLQPVFWQFQLADNLRPQQADHVRELGELETGEDLLGHRRAADDLASLQNDNFLARARQVSGSDQSIVAAADHDCIIFIGCHKAVSTRPTIDRKPLTTVCRPPSTVRLPPITIASY